MIAVLFNGNFKEYILFSAESFESNLLERKKLYDTRTSLMRMGSGAQKAAI